MTLVWIVVLGLGVWFGFELGRKWDAGIRELEAEETAQASARGGFRLKSITIRR
jgi:hypothetical protein